MSGLLNGSPVFLIGGGPSLQDIDLEPLSRPGVVTVGMNNSAASFRPNFWVSVDEPSHFIQSIWLDPKITKFTRVQNRDGLIFDNVSKSLTRRSAAECPNVFFFESDLEFACDDFLTRPSVSWGPAKSGGGRSVMLATLKLLYHLGAGHVFLLGVDFHMTKEYAYHFSQTRSSDSVTGNMKSYRLLEKYFTALRPRFEAGSFFVWNCNPDSRLKAFPHLPYEEAIRFATKEFPEPGVVDPTQGLYDREGGGNDSAELFPENTASHNRAGLRRIDRSKHPRSVPAPIVNGAAPLPGSSGVLLMADRDLEWLLPWWFHCFEQTNPLLKVALVDAGLSEEGRDYLARKEVPIIPLNSPLPDSVYPWFHKPFAIAQSPFDRTVFCDLDCEVRGDISLLFHWPGEGISLGKDLIPSGRYRKFFRERYYYNSGLVGIHTGDSVLVNWCDETLKLYRKFRSDQEILNFTLYETEATIVELPEHFHQLRLAGDHPDAVVMHWTGLPGKNHIQKRMKHLNLPLHL